MMLSEITCYDELIPVERYEKNDHMIVATIKKKKSSTREGKQNVHFKYNWFDYERIFFLHSMRKKIIDDSFVIQTHLQSIQDRAHLSMWSSIDFVSKEKISHFLKHFSLCCNTHILWFRYFHHHSISWICPAWEQITVVLWLLFPKC